MAQAVLMGISGGKPVLLSPASVVTWQRVCVGRTPIELTLDGAAPSPSNRLCFPDGSACALDLTVLAKSESGDVAAWRYHAVAACLGGAARILEASSQVSHADPGAAAWWIGLRTGDGGELRLVGAVDTSTRVTWSATGMLTLAV